MAFASILILGLAAALLTAVAAAVIMLDRHRQLRRLRLVRVERDRARTAAAAAIRTLRLAAIELRGPGTALLGHADRLRADGAAVAPVVAIAGQVLDLADDLQHHALGDATGRVLREEVSPLAPLLEEAVASVQASLGPSRRIWRLPEGAAGIALRVDRRAMAQILMRVLGTAARYSRHEDWIDVSVEVTPACVTLVVADEGNGLGVAQGAGLAGRADSRGLGLGLALARVLMQAHGGALSIESAASVGSRVTLTLPGERVVAEAMAEAV
jgi:signal transduction histidine kinase